MAVKNSINQHKPTRTVLKTHDTGTLFNNHRSRLPKHIPLTLTELVVEAATDVSSEL